MATQHKVTILYTAVDGSRMIKDFKTLNGAKGFAHKMIGEHPEMGGYYAVSGDGIGKVQVTGVALKELFPEKTTARVEPEMDEQAALECHEREYEETDRRLNAAFWAARDAEITTKRSPGAQAQHGDTEMYQASHIIAYYRFLMDQLDTALDRQASQNRALAYAYQDAILAYTWG